MIRGTLLTTSAIGMVLAIGSRASAQDEVTYYNHAEKKETRLTGSIEAETIAGIQFKDRSGSRHIPTLDIRHVAYKNDKVSVLEFRTLAAREERALAPTEKVETRRKVLTEVLKGYEEMLPKLKGVPAAQRYLQFKIVQIKFHLSRNDATQWDAAAAALKTFLGEHDKTWETVLSMQMLAQLQETKGDAVAAAKTYQEMAALPEMPADFKKSCAILEGKVLLRGRKFADAEKKFQALLAGNPAKDTAWAQLQVLLTQSQIGQHNLSKAPEQLQAALAASDDASIKAMVLNTRGEYFLQQNKPEDAFWCYLKAEALYGQEREEQARALYHLARLFESLKKDPLRAQQCRERLHLLEGTEYQKQAASEDKR